MEQNVLVTGGTGTLGKALVDRLRADGRRVRILSRRPGPDTAVGDLAANTGLDVAVSGITTIIHCATDGRTDVAATRNLIDAARRAGVTHLVYISIVGVDRHPLFYYRTKWRAEQLVESSGIPWTILRATQFHNLVFGLFRAQRWLPALFAPAFSFQPIAVRDVARRLTELAGTEPAGRAADIGGPEVLSGRELAAAYLARARSRRRIVSVCLPGKTFAAYAAGYHLAPENRDGTVTFADFLATNVIARKRPS
jgi:uncharacterized protein YbjT (DUF2867 family)